MIKKKKTILIISCIGLTACLLIVGLYIGKNVLFMNYLETVLSGEEFIYSYDNKYCYLPMYSERKRLCTLNIYETSTERIPGAEEQIVPGDLVFILPYYYDGNKINLISWGKENYNIYFDSKEAGKFCFIYENGEWQGPQKWDIYQ